MKCAYLIAFSLSAIVAVPQLACAIDYPLPPPDSRLIGQNQSYIVQEDDKNLQAIARKFNSSAMLLLEANNTIAPVRPMPGTQIIIPGQLLLPDTPREGIVVNLAELRLYYYPAGKNSVQVYPIGIGQVGLETPVMVTRVSQKIPNPTWTPPAGIRARSLAKGIDLPKVVPAGPGNPLGRYAMRLAQGNGEYLIHGTNAPDSVGLRVSSGCIRMNADDIERLFAQVPHGTRVEIIDEPVKFSVEPDGTRYVEAHRPLSREQGQDTQNVPFTLTSEFEAFAGSDASERDALDKVLARRAGYPVATGKQDAIKPGGATPAMQGVKVMSEAMDALEETSGTKSAERLQ